jgi:ferric-dicitrate binding protein FerR (iron transport regulator)
MVPETDRETESLQAWTRHYERVAKRRGTRRPSRSRSPRFDRRRARQRRMALALAAVIAMGALVALTFGGGA